MAIKVGDAVVYLNGNISDFQKKMKQADRETRKSIGAIVNVMQSAGKTMTTAGTVMMGALGFAAKGAADLGVQMAKVSTLGVNDLKHLERGVRDLAVEYGGDVMENAKSLYDLISAGIPEDAALLVMEEAIKGSVAGAGELSSALDLGTSIMNAFDKKGKDAAETTQNFSEIMGQAATAVKYGKTTIDDLGGAVGKAAALMNAAGVTSEEYLAAIAALTTTGAKASEQVSALKAALSSIIKPSEQAQVYIDLLGLDFSSAAVRSMGFAKFLSYLQAALQGAGAAIEKKRAGLLSAIATEEDHQRQIDEKVKALEDLKDRYNDVVSALRDYSDLTSALTQELSTLGQNPDTFKQQKADLVLMAEANRDVLASFEGRIQAMIRSGEYSRQEQNSLKGILANLKDVKGSADDYSNGIDRLRERSKTFEDQRDKILETAKANDAVIASIERRLTLFEKTDAETEAIENQIDALKNRSDQHENESKKLKDLRIELNEVNALSSDQLDISAELFGSVEGLNAILDLMGPRSEVFNAALGDMKNAQENLNTAFQKGIENDPSLTYRQTIAAMTDLRLEIGNNTLPTMDVYLDRINKINDGLRAWIGKHPELVEALGGFATEASIGSGVGGAFLVFLANSALLLSQAFNLVKLLGFAAVPFGIALAGIALASAAFIQMWTTGDWSTNFIREFTEKYIPDLVKAIDWVMQKASDLYDVLAKVSKEFGEWSDKSLTTPMPAFGTGFGYRQYATGTRNHPGGLAIVGEQGPELISMPRGSQVFTHSETRQMLGGASVSVGEINVYQQPGEDAASLARRIREEILNAQRFGLTRGGLVAAV